MFAAGALLCAMPQTAYWVAVYTGRMGDPVWGPVATHAATIAPVLYFGVAMVKFLQVRPIPVYVFLCVLILDEYRRITT